MRVFSILHGLFLGVRCLFVPSTPRTTPCTTPLIVRTCRCTCQRMTTGLTALREMSSEASSGACRLKSRASDSSSARDLVCMWPSQGKPGADRWRVVVSGSTGAGGRPITSPTPPSLSTNTMRLQPRSTASSLDERQTTPLLTNRAWPGNSMLQYMTLSTARPSSRLCCTFDSSLS